MTNRPKKTWTCRECGQEFEGLAGADPICDDCSDEIAEAEDEEEEESDDLQ